jgi:uncharacterized membrane protein YdjX (TVP38/TMEM64 family)
MDHSYSLPRNLHHLRLAVWFGAVLCVALFGASGGDRFQHALDAAGPWVWPIYVTLNVLCAFLLLPSMPLVLALCALLPEQPAKAWMIALSGVLASSLAIRYFAGCFGLARLLDANAHSGRLRERFARYGAWALGVGAAMPFFPTDLGCYVASAARMPLPRYLVAVLIGEGLLCAAVIAFGSMGQKALIS